MGLHAEQRATLEQILRMSLEDIIEAEGVAADLKLRAIDAIFINGKIPSALLEELKAADIDSNVEYLHRIFMHPNPQAMYNPSDELEGLLGLTAKPSADEPVTKADVIGVMREQAELAKKEIAEISADFTEANKQKSPQRDPDREIKEQYERVVAKFKAAHLDKDPEFTQKNRREFRALIEADKISVKAFSEIKLMDLLRLYLPLAPLFNRELLPSSDSRSRDVIRISDYHALARNNKEAFAAFVITKRDVDNDSAFLKQLFQLLQNTSPLAGRLLLKHLNKLSEEKERLVRQQSDYKAINEELAKITTDIELIQDKVREFESIVAQYTPVQVQYMEVALESGKTIQQAQEDFRKIPKALFKLVSKGVILIENLAGLNADELMKIYLPVADYLNNDKINFSDYHALSLDKKKIIALLASATGVDADFVARLPQALQTMPDTSIQNFLKFFMDGSTNNSRFSSFLQRKAVLLIFLEHSLMVNDAIDDRLITQYAALGNLFDANIITVEEYRALSPEKKELFRLFLSGGAYTVADDKQFIVNLYEEIDAADEDSIKPLLTDFRNIVQDPRREGPGELITLISQIKQTSGVEAKNILKHSSSAVTQKINDECKAIDTKVVNDVASFKEGKLLPEQKNTVLSQLLRGSSTLSDSTKAVYVFKCSIINGVIQASSSVSNLKNHLTVASITRAGWHKERLNEIIARNINLSDTEQLEFLQKTSVFSELSAVKAVPLIFLEHSLMVNDAIDDRLITQYAALGNLFDANIITVEEYRALSPEKKELFRLFLSGGAYTVADDKQFIVNLYREINAADEDSIKPLLTDFRNIVQDPRREGPRELITLISQIKQASGVEATNILKHSSSAVTQKINDECKAIDTKVVSDVESFKEGNLLPEQKNTVLSQLLRGSSTLSDSTKAAYAFKCSIINGVIQVSDSASNTENYLRAPQGMRAVWHKNKLNEIITSNINLSDAEQLDFLLKTSVFSELSTVEKLQESVRKTELKKCMLGITQSSAQDSFLQVLERVAEEVKSDLVKRAVYQAIYNASEERITPPIDFLLNSTLLSHMNRETFSYLIFDSPQHTGILKALLTNASLQKLNNTQIYQLFDAISKNEALKQELTAQPRLEPLSWPEAWKRGDNRWAEIVETMKDCVFKNTLRLKEGESKGGNLLALGQNEAAKPLLRETVGKKTSSSRSFDTLTDYASHQREKGKEQAVTAYAESRAARVTPATHNKK